MVTFPSSQILSLGAPIVFIYVHSNIYGVWVQSLLFEVFKTNELWVRKISISCAFCSITIISGLKKDAVCLAIDHLQASCPRIPFVNTSKTLNKCLDEFNPKPLPFIGNFWVTWTRESQVCLDLDNETQINEMITCKVKNDHLSAFKKLLEAIR